MDKAKSMVDKLEPVKVGLFQENETVESEEARQRRREKVEANRTALENLPPIKVNGNGTKPVSLWQVVTATSTFGIPSETTYSPILDELTEVRQKLWETEKEKQKLSKFYEHWLSNQFDSEALATADENAMSILSRFNGSEALRAADVIKNGQSEQWLALIRLVQADFVGYLGSYLYITARGKRVLDAVLNHEAVEEED